MRFLVLLLVAALAGCSDGSAPPACEGDTCHLPPVTDSTGLIRGITVDQAVVPLDNVTIEVLQGQEVVQEVRSDRRGTFLVADLPGGAYTLRASKPGYHPFELQQFVENGVQQPPVVRVMLSAIPGYNPFVNAFAWEGFIQCNTNYANPCLIVNYYPQAVLGLDPVLDDTSIHLWWEEFVDLGVSPDHLQVETVWEPTQVLGDALSIRYEVGDKDSVTIPCVFGSQTGDSPQVYRINGTQARDAGLGAPDPDPDDEGCDEETAHGFVMEFFAGDALGVCQPLPVAGCHPRLGVVVEQQTQSFLHAFYGYVPPEDWTFVDTSSVPPPS